MLRRERTWDSEHNEINLPLKLVTLIVILRVPNRIDCLLLQQRQQLIVDLVLVDELLVKSHMKDRPSTNSYQELIYQVITNQHHSNLVMSILSREHQGVKGLNHPNNNVKHLSADNHHNSKHQHRSS